MNNEGLQEENKEILNITNALETIKEGLISKETGGSNTQTKDTALNEIEVAETYSEQIVPSTSKANNEINLRKCDDTDRNLEPTASQVSESGSLSSLDESMSTALLTLAERFEDITSVESSDRIPLDSDDMQQLSVEENDCLRTDENSEKNKENIFSTTAEEDLENLNLGRDPSNEDNDNQITSETTYSQETVKLNEDTEQLSENSDETDAGKNADKEQLTQILSYSKNDGEIQNVSSEKNYTPDSDDANKLTMNEQPTQIVSRRKNIDRMKDMSPEKYKTTDSDETDIDEDANNLSMFEHLPQVSDHPKNVNDVEDLSSEENKTVDYDETGVDEGAGKYLRVVGHLKSIDDVEHLPSKKTSSPDSDETDVDEDTNRLSTFEEHPQMLNKLSILEISKEIFNRSRRDNLIDSTKNVESNETNTFSKNGMEQASEGKNGQGSSKMGANEPILSQITDSQETSENIDENIDKIISEINKSDSDEPDVDKDSNKPTMSEPSLQSFNSSENILSKKSNREDLLETEKNQVYKHEESDSGRDEPDAELSVAMKDITQTDESRKILPNAEEENSSQSNKSFIFNINKNNDIGNFFASYYATACFKIDFVTCVF